MKKFANLRVGKPDVTPDKPAHTPGVRMGNKPGSLEKQAGFNDEGLMATGTAQRSTGINPEARNPIDPNSPNLSPA